MMVRSSRVDQPPVSGVPVAGATKRGDVSLGMDGFGERWVVLGGGTCMRDLRCRCRWRDRRAFLFLLYP